MMGVRAFRWPVVAAAVLMVLAGCAPQSGSHPSHQAKRSPGAAVSPRQAPLADWQAKGATEVPPAALADPSTSGIQVVNQTGGAVSDADAVRWAKALVRGIGYEWWAINHMQDQFLVRSGLGSPADQVFKWDLGNVTGARQGGMTVQGQRLVLRRLVLRPIPQTLKPTFASYLFTWTPYAFFLDEVGPGDLFWVDGLGNKTSKWHVDGGVGSPELVGGRLLRDPLMGEVWVQSSDWTCATPDSRRTFGSLCSS